MISPLVRRRRLASELRSHREAAGLTAEHLARKIGQSRMKISRLENASNRPSVADVMKVLDALEIDGDRWHELVKIANDAADRGWWEAYGEHMGARQVVYADLEYGASTVREYHNNVVPGLLQTSAYTRSRVSATRPKGWVPADLDKTVEARGARQRMLLRPDGPTYEVILEEVAVRRPAAPREIMQEQLRCLADLAEGNPRVSVRILAVDAKIADYWLPRSSFSLYTYQDPGDPLVAAVDTENVDLVLTDGDEVSPYSQLYDRLRCAALPPEEGLALLRSVAGEGLGKENNEKR